jgi:hypothetical protein
MLSHFQLISIECHHAGDARNTLAGLSPARHDAARQMMIGYW